MEDVRKLAIKTLRSAFKDAGVKVFPTKARFTGKKEPEEYIVIYLVSSVYTAYANGRPIRQRDTIDVDYYGKDLEIKTTREKEIIKKLAVANFRPVELFSGDDSVSDERGYHFSTASLSIEQVI